MNADDRALTGLHRQAEAAVACLHDLTIELRAAVRALTGIHAALDEANRDRDRWAHAVVDVLDDAKGGTDADADGR